MPPSLTLDDIADGAIRLIEQLGPSKVTARNLGAELHVAAATLYTVVRSLDEVDAAARSKLSEQWQPQLDQVVQAGSVIPFVDSVAARSRNAGLFMTDPTRDGPRSLDFARRLFPAVRNDDLLADKQAIVHAAIRAGGSTAFDLSAVLAAHDASLNSAGDHMLLTAPASPGMTELVEQVIDVRVSGDRRQLLTRVGIELIDQGGVDEWVFRRVVEASGVPLTTVHRAGDRHSHLTGLASILSEAAWLRSAELTGADGRPLPSAMRIGIAAREMQPGPNPSLLMVLQRPRNDAGPPASLIPAEVVNDRQITPALEALAAIFVSRYVRSGVAPEAWESAPQLIAALADAWPTDEQAE